MPTNFSPAAPPLSLRLVPLHAVHQNLRHVGERLDVVQRGWLVENALRHRERRLVARLGAFAFDGFDQRALFAADVSAGADEEFQIEGEAGAEHARAQNALLRSSARSPACRICSCASILVPDVEDALLRAGHQARDDHALDHQVRQIAQDEAVFDGAGLAFIGVADHVFFAARRLANGFPLHAGGKSRAAQAAESAGFQLRDHAVPIARRD